MDWNRYAKDNGNNVRRLIVQSSLGVGDSRDNLNFYWKHIMFGMLLRNAYNDHIKQEKTTLLFYGVISTN